MNPALVPAAVIAFAVLLQLELVFSKSINWDEFHHFSQIHRHLQDRPMQWLQAPFVWLFSWVPSIPGDNIDHIQLIRLFILPFELITIAAIVASAQRFVSQGEALFCALLYITGGYVFLHAFALRADMIAASLLTVALWIGICRPLRALEIAVFTALVVLAFVATIKSVLYAPAFLGVALFRLQKSSHRWALAGAVAGIMTVGLMLLLIAPLLPESGLASPFRDIGVLGRDSVNRMFSAGLFPQPTWLRGQVLRAPLLVMAVALALVFVFKRDQAPRERLLVVCLLLPLFTVSIYRNAFPYHFVFILPPAAIAVAPAIRPLLQRYGLSTPSLVLLGIACMMSLAEDRSVLYRQRMVQAGLHEIFRSPVTYIDDCGMLGNFPRAINHFASGWGLENYRRNQSPTYSMAIEAEPVPLLLANNGVLLGPLFEIGVRGVLVPQDEQTIRETYIQHWGKVFVAGKRFQPGNELFTFDIAVPGPYTVEGGPIILDGRDYQAGSVIDLARGKHTLSKNDAARITLRWGNHLRQPAYPWPDDPLFTYY